MAAPAVLFSGAVGVVKPRRFSVVVRPSIRGPVRGSVDHPGMAGGWVCVGDKRMNLAVVPFDIPHSPAYQVSLRIFRDRIAYPKPSKFPCDAAVPLGCFSRRKRKHNDTDGNSKMFQCKNQNANARPPADVVLLNHLCYVCASNTLYRASSAPRRVKHCSVWLHVRGSVIVLGGSRGEGSRATAGAVSPPCHPAPTENPSNPQIGGEPHQLRRTTPRPCRRPPLPWRSGRGSPRSPWPAPARRRPAARRPRRTARP